MQEVLHLKVCGMKHAQNIAEVGLLPIDFMGFIFFERSARFAGELSPETINLPTSVRRVGVFVDASVEEMERRILQFGLNALQLHGSESPDLVCRLKTLFPELLIIKTFGIASEVYFAQTEAYETVADLFLFDTKTPQHGGSGKKFDWQILEAYKGKTPFWLSGGIAPNDAPSIRQISHPKLFGIDLNSRFETEAGRKNIDTLRTFIEEIKQ